MRILRARYRSGEDFLRHYQPSFPDGGVFFPTREALEVGQAVLVEVRLPPVPQKLMIRGTVAWRRAGRHRTKLRAGLGIEFHSGDAVRRDFLLSAARGEINANLVLRRCSRLPVELPAEWRIAADRISFKGVVEDIGPGGAFVRSSQAVSPGTEVVLDVVPPGGVRPLSIACRVAWSRRTTGDEGFGVEFRVRDGGGARRIKELVRRLEKLEYATAISAEEDEADSAPA
jgi:Tfp pilus assembly protein PilZ